MVRALGRETSNRYERWKRYVRFMKKVRQQKIETDRRSCVKLERWMGVSYARAVG